MLAVIGCDSAMDRLIPASVHPRACEYVGMEWKDIYSLYDLKVIADEVVIQHREAQIDLKRLSEDDKYAYQDATGFISQSISEAEAFKEAIVGDDSNPLSMSGLLFMLTGGLVGRSFFRRPGDLTPEEAKAKGAQV
jgi:hypothetical protein